MARVHLVLQGKGGVGKTFAASLMAQYCVEKNVPAVCVDTDPVNSTFAQYHLGVLSIKIMNAGKIDGHRFDDLIEMLVNKDGADFIIDNGAATFVPLTNYMAENGVIETLVEAGKPVVVHTVLTGGQGATDTQTGFERLLIQFGEKASLVVWLNEFFGQILVDGKDFEESPLYLNNRDRIFGIVRIIRRSEDTFGRDMEKMLNSKMTFGEAIESSKFQFMAKKRLKMVRDDLFAQISALFETDQAVIGGARGTH